MSIRRVLVALVVVTSVVVGIQAKPAMASGDLCVVGAATPYYERLVDMPGSEWGLLHAFVRIGCDRPVTAAKVAGFFTGDGKGASELASGKDIDELYAEVRGGCPVGNGRRTGTRALGNYLDYETGDSGHPSNDSFTTLETNCADPEDLITEVVH